MGEEEEEVLGYLDRVLEEEMVEYGDGDPITLTHRHFKVRQRPDSWVQDDVVNTSSSTVRQCTDRKIGS